mgnify:CR=1 FL=1
MKDEKTPESVAKQVSLSIMQLSKSAQVLSKSLSEIETAITETAACLRSASELIDREIAKAERMKKQNGE